MRVLVIQTAFIGDVALTTPFIVALRERFKDAELHVVATPQGCALLEGLAGVFLHSLDKKKHGVREGLERVRVSLDPGGEGFDWVFCVHRSLRSLWLGRVVRSKNRVAFRSIASCALGYLTVPYPDYKDSTHYADKPLALFAPLGIEVKRGRPVLAVEQWAAVSARAKLAPLGAFDRYAVISPFSVWGTKMWFADRYGDVGTWLAHRYQMPVVLIGASEPRETSVGRAIAEKIQASGARALSLVGETSLGELKEIIRSAALVVANDSAPVHIAAAFDVPTVAVFGPTTRKWGFSPLATRASVVERRDVSCRPCHVHGPPKCPQGHFKCMDLIQVEDVEKAIQDLIDA